MVFGKRIEMTGRVGSKPTIVNEINGQKLVRFTLATIEYCICNGQNTQHTQWYTVNTIGKTAEELLACNIVAGCKISLSGNWLIDEYKDRYNNKRYNCEIFAENISPVVNKTNKNINRA